jgi:prepilin-type N-terminal cleavage/methylation domain-containing protein
MINAGPVHGVRCPCRGLWRSRGFTAIELLLVMAIIGTFAAIAIPRINTVLCRQRADQAGQRLASDISRVSALARSTSRTWTITFNRSAARYTVTGTDASGTAVTWAVRLIEDPYLCSMSAVEFGVDQALTINGHGIASESGRVELASGTASTIVSVDPTLPAPVVAAVSR